MEHVPKGAFMQLRRVNPALRRKGEVGVWQLRFWEHHIRDETNFAAHVR